MSFYSVTRSQQGFTLLEVLVTLSIIAILAGLASPAMREFSRNQKIVAAITDLSSDIQYARSEAVAKSTTVKICPSGDGANCANTDNWQAGWIIYFTDPDKCPAEDDCVIRVRDALSAALSLNSSASEGVVFDDQGLSSVSENFALCDKERPASDSDHFLRTLTIKTSGTSYVKKGASSCNP